jgi:hypothetical protein
MKSAYELAMERLDRQHGKVAVLSEAQKAALAEIDRRVVAKRAELDILYRDKIAQARATGDAVTILALEDEVRRETVRCTEAAEEEKAAVRRDASLA